MPLPRSHLTLAHAYWKEAAAPGSILIDATCGNGKDTLFLAGLAPAELHVLDIQEEALGKAREHLRAQLSPEEWKSIHFHQRCHSTFPESIQKGSVALCVYNLGYLPGGDKNVTTMTSTTLQSLGRARELLMPGGMISVTCYPGHEEGFREEAAILEMAAALAREEWNCCHHRWLNRRAAPSLLLIQKNNI